MYSKQTVEKLVGRLREEYAAVLKKQQEAVAAIKEENRILAARVSELEAERGNVAEALIGAAREGEELRKEGAREAANSTKELAMLIAKCRLLCNTLTAKYPDAEDVRSFASFVDTLRGAAGEEDYEDTLDMDEVLAPSKPLDLEKLCKDLGLMEEEA